MIQLLATAQPSHLPECGVSSFNIPRPVLVADPHHKTRPIDLVEPKLWVNSCTVLLRERDSQTPICETRLL
jgi:hypothetical protein